MEILAFCSPLYEDVALNELAPLGARPQRRIAPGAFVLQGDLSPAEAVERVEAASLTFTRQVVVGVQHTALAGAGDAAALEIVRAAPAGAFATGQAFVCHPDGGTNDALAALQEAVRNRLAAETTAPRRRDEGPPRALAAVISGSDALVGLALRSRWPAGRPQFHPSPEPVSRAAFKLLEALDVFAIATPAGARALDLGASPGGWTQVLAGRGLRVVAVDPGALDPRVATLPDVEIHRTLAQTYLSAATEPFDLIVDDMRLDARESAEIIVQAARLLEPDGVGLMTFKLPERAPTGMIRQAQAVLRRAFPWQEARCLYYNRREITVCLRPESL